jgi:hypothetical protein
MLQDHIVKHQNFGIAASSLQKFFKDKAGFKVPDAYLAKHDTVGGAGRTSGSAKPRICLEAVQKLPRSCREAA